MKIKFFFKKVFQKRDRQGAERISRIIYNPNGLIFWFKGENINQIVLFKPSKGSARQIEEESWDEEIHQVPKIDKSFYTDKTWEEAFIEALSLIHARKEWPKTPEELAKVFWKTRARKDYKEMEILWPGSGSWKWAEICKSDPDVNYVCSLC
ncbi:MAG: hypothetical protein ACYSUK_10260 [Planctomycetota bacterium]|jgi:hypothetical protein